MHPREASCPVVDDEPPQLEILRLILGAEGYEAATAGAAATALAALRRQPFEVVLTDLKMPDLSGIALLEQIQREQPGACVVLMTAHGRSTRPSRRCARAPSIT